MAIYDFDAGDMGCADGLAQAFVERIGAINTGDVLRITASDPAARTDLPSLARMRGHTVEDTHEVGDGRTQFIIRRGQ